jgi:hypothetical protein
MAHGPGLAEVATWIGDELELPTEVAELLSVDLLAPVHHPIDDRAFERAVQELTLSVRQR